MGQIYKWRTGARIKADATLAAKVFEQLSDENRLNAENVVEVSKPEEAVLHDDFEWVDSIAAFEYRKHQARNILNSLVVIEEETPEEQPIRYCFKIEEKTNNYTPLNVIMQSAESTGALIRKAISELQAYRMKYDTIIKKCHGEIEIQALSEKLEKAQ